jgi:nitric oxide reductase subunit B
MVFLSLLPVGYLQIKEAFFNGYAASRSSAFLKQETVEMLLTLRAIPDTIFLIGVAALALFSIKALFNLRKVTHKEEEPLPVMDLAVEED